MKENLWSWDRGIVDRDEDHIEIRYGSIKDSGYDEWIPAALISAPKEHRFLVEFLIPEEAPKNIEIIMAIKGELDFYLVKKGEMDPWAYACYHCGTSANAYSDVHWSFFPKGWERKQ